MLQSVSVLETCIFLHGAFKEISLVTMAVEICYQVVHWAGFESASWQLGWEGPRLRCFWKTAVSWATKSDVVGVVRQCWSCVCCLGKALPLSLKMQLFVGQESSPLHCYMLWFFCLFVFKLSCHVEVLPVCIQREQVYCELCQFKENKTMQNEISMQ